MFVVCFSKRKRECHNYHLNAIISMEGETTPFLQRFPNTFFLFLLYFRYCTFVELVSAFGN